MGVSLWRQVAAVVALLRPLNVAMMAIAVAVGAVLAAGAGFFLTPGSGTLLPAAMAAMAIGAGANAINDVFDFSIDSINRPGRPLPAGLISERTARACWLGLSGAGIGLAALISWAHVLIAAASVALLYSYSANLKRRPVLGNLAVALVIGLALPFGGLVPLQLGFGETLPVVAGALFAFATTLSREIVKDIEDVVGDRAAGARTLPIAAGVRFSGGLATAFILVTVALLPAAQLLGLGSPFLGLSLPAALLLLAAAWAALGTLSAEPAHSVQSAGRASGLLKGGMLAGLIALALTAW